MSKAKRVLILMAAIVAVFVLSFSALLAMPPVQDQPSSARPEISQLLEKSRAEGSVPVIVGFALSGGFDPVLMGADETRAGLNQSAAVHQAQDALISRLSGYAVTIGQRFDYVPYIALQVDEAALQALWADPAVTSIVEDLEMAPAMTRSLPLTRAEGAHMIGYRGAGTAIAVLDTGYDKDHPDLAGKIVAEACYSTTDLTSGRFSACPNGQNSQIGNGSAAALSRFFSGFDHGTHVAAIAAGVAPDAKIVAIQVFGRIYETAEKQCTSADRRSPCMLSRQSDYIKGLERVMTLRTTHNIVAVNMSLGGGSYVSSCDNLAQFATEKLLIQSLRNNGVLTIASAGNSSYKNSMGAPACLSSTVSVGATVTWPDDQVDRVADFSNVGFGTSIFAPGQPINAAVPRWTTDCDEANKPFNSRCSKGGTSMAAPHVAGAVAVLRAARPDLTANQTAIALTSNGPLVTDQRPGGTITRRRLDVYGALCTVVACDPDDFRILSLFSNLSGTIASGDPQDIYYFNGTANQRIIVTMTRVNGTLDPYLSVWDPDGNIIAFNDNGGGGVNTRINLLILPRTGRYRIQAGKTATSQTGAYTVSISQGSSSLNPEPFVRFSDPNLATVGSAGFWVKIHGSNFVSSSVARLNGSPRSTFFSNSELIWIWIESSDMTSTGSRSINVVNPTPGGGQSLPVSFSVTAAFNGFSRLLAPEETTTSVGQKTQFAVEWVHPTASWRNMQSMEFKLADDVFGGPLWLRLTEDNPESTLYLLNSAGVPLYSGTLVSGQFGTDEEWVVDDTVTLHFGETKFFGSGQTIVLTPTVTFGPDAAGSYTMRFAVDDDKEESEVQDGDVFGRFTILPEGCLVAAKGVTLDGPETATTGTPVSYTVSVDPPDATGPLVYTWFPEPESGQGTATATYEWSGAGQKPVGIIVESCADMVTDIQTVAVHTSAEPDLSLGLVAPAVALPGNPITYTITISNSGALTATNIIVSDVVPPGAIYSGGGTLDGNVVSWAIPVLPGFGRQEQVAFAVTASETITNSTYYATAAGGYSTAGGSTVVTTLVDALATAGPLDEAKILYEGGGVKTEVTFPAGSVFAQTSFAYRELTMPSQSLPSGATFAGRAFRLDGYQENGPSPDLEPGEPFSITLTYLDGDVAGLDASMVTLVRHTASGWSNEGIECLPEPGYGRVVCTVFAQLGEFVLVASNEERMLYLPAVVR